MTRLSRRGFLQLAATAPLLALAPWRTALPQIKRVTMNAWTGQVIVCGASVYRWMTALQPLSRGDLVFWDHQTLAGIAAGVADRGGACWVQIGGPASVEMVERHG